MRVLAVIALSLLIFSCQSMESPTVSVTGSAVIETQPDTLMFTVAARYTAPTTDEALSVASAMVDYAVSLLTASYGVSAEDIRTEYFSVSPSYSYSEGVETLVGQCAEERLSVTLRDITRAGELVKELSEIDGIEVSGLRGDKSDKTDEQIKARTLAVHDAYERAAVYANAIGYALGDLISISSSDDAGIVPAKVYMTSASSDVEYYAGTIEIRDEVNAVFSLVE